MSTAVLHPDNLIPRNGTIERSHRILDELVKEPTIDAHRSGAQSYPAVVEGGGHYYHCIDPYCTTRYRKDTP
ncbi:MAG: hypothetical protein LH475_01955 [Cryobacterium sp.]|uniref:hypothetical protein n=1 Tax=unclassified Cryobacterium TaxID=2649013 RepID=UPI0018CA4C5F|nr:MULTISPECIES: hypothetical protein [unclassified Cryobacterium]MCY7403394.1 hypothetical protein [Cryobacterium sp.]MEC5153438.1 hypothetical protein [Cryobacterium sp. CAN_C3]